MRIKLETGKQRTPKDDDEVRCEVHGTITTWGALDAIQQLAVAENIDTLAELKCLLAPAE